MIEQNSRSIRSDSKDWPIISRADNDVEIIEHVIHVKDVIEAAEVASKVAPLIYSYDQLKSNYTMIISLMHWKVTISLSVPTGFWAFPEQKMLTERITEILQDKE